MRFRSLVLFCACAGIWVNWSTGSWLTSEHKAHPRQARRRVEQSCPAVLTSLSITRNVWCSARNWAQANRWLPWLPSSKSSWGNMPGRSFLETCLSKTCWGKKKQFLLRYSLMKQEENGEETPTNTGHLKEKNKHSSVSRETHRIAVSFLICTFHSYNSRLDCSVTIPGFTLCTNLFLLMLWWGAI